MWSVSDSDVRRKVGRNLTTRPAGNLSASGLDRPSPTAPVVDLRGRHPQSEGDLELSAEPPLDVRAEGVGPGHGFNMNDSEPSVNEAGPQSGVHDSESISMVPAKLANMPSNRDTVLSDFVRAKIAEWQAGGREQQELAELAGFAKSTVAQVKKGTGVGAKTAPGFARAFGFPDVQTMVDAAYEWRKSSGLALDELLAEPEVQAAIQQVLTFVAGSTEESVRAILAAFTHPRFRGRDRMYWWETLGKEAKRDADAAISHATDMKARRQEKSSGQKRMEEAWGEAGTLKRRQTELQAVASNTAAAHKPKMKTKAS
jgi:hypothetical protein